jgi:hypothetical protein
MAAQFQVHLSFSPARPSAQSTVAAALKVIPNPDPDPALSSVTPVPISTQLSSEAQSQLVAHSGQG